MTGKEVREKHMKQKTMSRSKIVQCDFGKKDARMKEKIIENRIKNMFYYVACDNKLSKNK